MLTSFDMASPFINYFLGDVIIDELLEANAMQEARAQTECSGQAQQHDGNREVDIEAIGYKWHNVHVPHNLQGIYYSVKRGINMTWRYMHA